MVKNNTFRYADSYFWADIALLYIFGTAKIAGLYIQDNVQYTEGVLLATHENTSRSVNTVHIEGNASAGNVHEVQLYGNLRNVFIGKNYLGQGIKLVTHGTNQENISIVDNQTLTVNIWQGSGSVAGKSNVSYNRMYTGTNTAAYPSRVDLNNSMITFNRASNLSINGANNEVFGNMV